MIIGGVVYGLFGLVVGSFLNVVILRHGARGLGGRSGCMACGRQLRWWEMVPVVSWITLGGRCAACRAPISIQYPLVELLTGVIFALVGFAPMPLSLQLLTLPIMALLIIIAAYDLRHTIIPDEWVYAFAALALITAFTAHTGSWAPANIVWMLAAGPIAAAPLLALWAVSRGAWMGLGDPKLALGMGWFLGLPAGLYAVGLAFVIGAIISVFVLLPWSYVVHRISLPRVEKTFTMKSEVPFGPFLAASALVMWVVGAYGIAIPFAPFSL